VLGACPATTYQEATQELRRLEELLVQQSSHLWVSQAAFSGSAGSLV
jgi:hypothetical protein